jgi:hypothetical protein
VINGELFGLYVDGKTYTNNFVTQLDNANDGSDKRIPSYMATSTSVDIIEKGVVNMVNGKAYIKFNDNFSSVVSDTLPIIVTVSPKGKSNAVYVESVSKDGFTVVENNDGHSNVQIMWIAIGTKAGYENPDNTPELLTTDFDRKMDGVMFNDNDSTRNATPIWWDGTKVSFDPMPSSLTFKKTEDIRPNAIRQANASNKMDKINAIIKEKGKKQFNGIGN